MRTFCHLAQPSCEQSVLHHSVCEAATTGLALLKVTLDANLPCKMRFVTSSIHHTLMGLSAYPEGGGVWRPVVAMAAQGSTANPAALQPLGTSGS